MLFRQTKERYQRHVSVDELDVDDCDDLEVISLVEAMKNVDT